MLKDQPFDGQLDLAIRQLRGAHAHPLQLGIVVPGVVVEHQRAPWGGLADDACEFVDARVAPADARGVLVARVLRIVQQGVRAGRKR